MAQTFAQKLNLKPGQVLALVNPPQGMIEVLAAQLPDNPLAAGAAGQAEAVLVFLTKQDEAGSLTGIYANLKSGGLAWAAYPKGGVEGAHRSQPRHPVETGRTDWAGARCAWWRWTKLGRRCAFDRSSQGE